MCVWGGGARVQVRLGTFVSLCLYVCVLILLYMCPHTASALTGDAAAAALYIRAYTAHRRDRVKDMLQYGAVQGAIDQVSGRISALKDP